MSDVTLLPPDVIAALRAGNKIGAIKLLREKTGLGLKESKDAVDAAENGDAALKQARERAEAQHHNESSGLGTAFLGIYKTLAFLMFVAFLVILFTPGATFREAGAWLDRAIQVAP